MRSFFGTATTILAILVLAACPSGVEGPTGGGGAGGEATPELTFGASDCGSCVADVCQSHVAACESDPECAVYLECLRACPLAEGGDADPACEAACPLPNAASGKGAVTALTSCRTTGEGALSCEPCGRTPAAHPLLSQTCPPPTATEPCARCEEERCCETRCNADCQAYASCMQTCGGMIDCEDGCAAANPAGVQELSRWLGCQVPLCGDVCASLVPGPCLECGLEHCANQFADCFAQPECFLRFRCGSLCGDDACFLACDDKYPESEALFSAFLVCVGQHCLGGPCSGKF